MRSVAYNRGELIQIIERQNATAVLPLLKRVKAEKFWALNKNFPR